LTSIRSLAVALTAVAALAVSAPAQAQGYEFTLGVLGGIGGTDDTGDYGQSTLQVLVGFETAPRTIVGIRAGTMALDASGALPEGDLRWITLSTEYKVPAGFYDSGLYIGIGHYSVESDDGLIDDSAFGLNLGVTGDFPINRYFSVLVDLSGHYADLESSQILLMGQAGLAFHF
jgi:hypothetical protein